MDTNAQLLMCWTDSDKPPSTDGYDVKTNADDIAELMKQLGHEKYHVHGEVGATSIRHRTLQISC
jgi:hypothetical protein